ncbi:hypothetical protein [Microbispora sp. H10885]|uniref:hypothetical protein n=1 Tax=Microbispora sp. H10885 TaxID=2729110 RepID=UPI001C728390|nr:hypothetical protein [Microbispora sp. H10885]
MAGEEWDVYVVTEVREWIEQLDDATHTRVVQAIDALAEGRAVEKLVRGGHSAGRAPV